MFKLLSTLYNIHFNGYLIHTYINISSLPVGLSELIQTEFHHVRTLRIMEGVYRRGMQEEVMLEAGVVHTIFPCLDQLLEWHTSFLSALLNRRKKGLMEGSSTNFTVRRIGVLLLRQVRQLRSIAASRLSEVIDVQGRCQLKNPECPHLTNWSQTPFKEQLQTQSEKCRFMWRETAPSAAPFLRHYSYWILVSVS